MTNLNITKFLVHKVAGKKCSDNQRVSAAYWLLLTTLLLADATCALFNKVIIYSVTPSNFIPGDDSVGLLSTITLIDGFSLFLPNNITFYFS